MPKDKEQDQILHMRVSADFWTRIDDWRVSLRPIPNRSEAVRYLVDLGLRVARTEAKPPASQTKPRPPQKSRQE